MTLPTISLEFQLLDWSESRRGGAKVVFGLSSPEELDVFRVLNVKSKGVAGQRFAAVLVMLDDEDKPVAIAQDTPEQPLSAIAGDKVGDDKPKGGALAQWAAIKCGEYDFFAFIRPVYDKHMGGDGNGTGDIEI